MSNQTIPDRLLSTVVQAVFLVGIVLIFAIYMTGLVTLAIAGFRFIDRM